MENNHKELVNVLIGLVLTALEFDDIEEEVAGALEKVIGLIIVNDPDSLTEKGYKDLAFNHMAQEILNDANVPLEIKDSVKKTMEVRDTLEKLFFEINKSMGIPSDLWNKALEEIDGKHNDPIN